MDDAILYRTSYAVRNESTRRRNIAERTDEHDTSIPIDSEVHDDGHDFGRDHFFIDGETRPVRVD